MFDALKRFVEEVSGAEIPARSFDEEDYRLAAVALLIHVANVDGRVDLAERRKLQTILKERFDLDATAAAKLTALAEQSDREAVDFYHFTSVLKRALDPHWIWGNSFFNNSGCNIEGSTVCSNNVKLVRQVAVGFWDDIYKGPFGRLAGGLNYTFTQKYGFNGIGVTGNGIAGIPGTGGAPKRDENTFFTSLRYYPF